MNTIKVYSTSKFNDANILGKLGTPGSAGFDIRSAGTYFLKPGEMRTINTGIYTKFTRQLVAIVKEKSGLAERGVCIQAGVIDSDYRGEWKIVLRYDPPIGCVDREKPLSINPGDKIAQVIFIDNLALSLDFKQLLKSEWEEILLNEKENKRGSGGFGSTGV